MNNNDEVRWLQLSDIHITLSYSTQMELLKIGYTELAKVFQPDFIIVTGDFINRKEEDDYGKAKEFLEFVVKTFGVKRQDVFLVPGNHDAMRIKYRDEIASSVLQHDNDPDFYIDKLDRLKEAFKDYDAFAKSFYGRKLGQSNPRYCDPSGVYYQRWRKKINIIGLNTALISCGSGIRNEVFDIRQFNSIIGRIDKKLPTIIIAHHSPDCLIEAQCKQLKRYLDSLKIRAYLCGDTHKTEITLVNKVQYNQTPCIICGVSNAQKVDNYSDVSVIGYTWTGNKAYVNIFEWTGEKGDCPYRFLKSNMWYHNVDKPFSFKMSDEDLSDDAIDTNQIDMAWDEFVKAYERKDNEINSKLAGNSIENKMSCFEPFCTEKIIRSLITIGLPLPAVAEITRKTIESFSKLLDQNSNGGLFKTKDVRFLVLDSIKSMSDSKWRNMGVATWYTKYVRRYGHNNRIIRIYNIPPCLSEHDTVDANYRFIKEILLKDLFKTICPEFKMDTITSAQRTNLANELMEFISNCDLYLIDYSVLKPMAQELLTKPPHPCIIDNRLREQIIEYNRHSVYSNLSAIQGYKERNERIPETVFIELLHHTSAMLLSKYFNFCGCSDLDSYNILTSYIESMIQTQTGESSEFSNEDAVVRLHCDMRRYGITENELYEVLRSVRFNKMYKHSESKRALDMYTDSIVEYANIALNIVGKNVPDVK